MFEACSGPMNMSVRQGFASIVPEISAITFLHQYRLILPQWIGHELCSSIVLSDSAMHWQ